MDNKTFELSNSYLNEIKDTLEKYINKKVNVAEIVATSKKTPKITNYEGIMLSVSKNIFNIKMDLGKNCSIVKSFLLSDILINKISISLIK